MPPFCRQESRAKVTVDSDSLRMLRKVPVVTCSSCEYQQHNLVLKPLHPGHQYYSILKTPLAMQTWLFSHCFPSTGTVPVVAWLQRSRGKFPSPQPASLSLGRLPHDSTTCKCLVSVRKATGQNLNSLQFTENCIVWALCYTNVVLECLTSLVADIT